LRKLIIACVVAALMVFSAPSDGTPAGGAWMNTPILAASSQFGVASWYGPGFQGRPTASGPPFNMNAMTCAHRELPLGTRVRVTDLVNSRTVVLKVNDRGPYVGGRVLDVSRAAAEYLGFRNAGVAPVRIEIVSYPRPRPTIPPGPDIVASATRPADQ
jgi:rare lipoprotein A